MFIIISSSFALSTLLILQKLHFPFLLHQHKLLIRKYSFAPPWFEGIPYDIINLRIGVPFGMPFFLCKNNSWLKLFQMFNCCFPVHFIFECMYPFQMPIFKIKHFVCWYNVSFHYNHLLSKKSKNYCCNSSG